MNFANVRSLSELEPSADAQGVRPGLSARQLSRLERDRERGYSINVKQVILAFTVEFVIIGLILTNIYVTIAQLPDQSSFKIVQAMLFPIAMAMVELARVPLALAVRTQTSWGVESSCAPRNDEID